MCKCNRCGREITNDYDICELCKMEEMAYRQEILALMGKYGSDKETLEREIRKLNFKRYSI